MEFPSGVDDSVGFFADGNNEIFSRSARTPIPEVGILDEKDQLRILNELFGSPGLAAFGNVDFDQSINLGSDCNCEVEQKPENHGVNSCEKDRASVGDVNTNGLQNEMPVLSRRKSNPFYCPSRQIVDLVSRRRKSKTPTLVKSQSSAAVLTMSQIHDKRKPNKRPGAGSPRTIIK